MIDLKEKFQIEYPSSDGKRMAENTQQFRELVKIKLNLETTTDGQNIFVAGDLLWYPVEGNNTLCVAPDVMVVIGRPKGDRDSYKQWEEDNMPPQVAFEIWSPTNYAPEKRKKLAFYDKYGVQEYYTYDTHRDIFKVYIRDEEELKLVPNVKRWKSKLLGIRLHWTNNGLELYHPNGERFLTYMELEKNHKKAVENLSKTIQLLRAARTELKTTKSDLQVIKSDLQTTKSDLQTTKSDLQTTKQELLAEKKRTDQLAEKNRLLMEKLKAMGLNPKDLL